MDIFHVLNLIGGLALFIFGMNSMGDSLSKLSGGTMERLLERLTAKPIMGVLLGAGVTAIIQSSSATTVMVVGFVNSGIMRLSQAIGIIMGANIGTTITSWILSLTGIQGDSIVLQLLKPTSFTPVLAAIGVAMLMFSKVDKKKDIGGILLGFAVLMYGMESMTNAVKPLGEMESFTGILTMFSNPLLGVLAGMILTAAIQSSSASVGILQALCATGAVTFGTAIPIIMGQNIGTCVTALISAIGASKNAKRAAMVHLYFNIIGSLVFLSLFYILNAVIHFGFLGEAANGAGIAIVHTAFNVLATFTLLPFAKKLEKLAIRTIKDKETDNKEVDADFARLEERFLSQPSIAVEQAKNVSMNMAKITEESLVLAINALSSYNRDVVRTVKEMETRVDQYEDKLGTYLVKLSKAELSVKDSRTLSVILHSIGDFERISDHALNIVKAAEEMNEKGLVFSENAQAELKVYSQAILDILRETMKVFVENDIEGAKSIEPLEQVIDQLHIEIKQRHINRLRSGECTIELGFILSDISNNYERIADHCSNIAVCTIEVSEDGFDTHEYLGIMKGDNNKAFRDAFDQYAKEYILPK